MIILLLSSQSRNLFVFFGLDQVTRTTGVKVTCRFWPVVSYEQFRRAERAVTPPLCRLASVTHMLCFMLLPAHTGLFKLKGTLVSVVQLMTNAFLSCLSSVTLATVHTATCVWWRAAPLASQWQWLETETTLNVESGLKNHRTQQCRRGRFRVQTQIL